MNKSAVECCVPSIIEDKPMNSDIYLDFDYDNSESPLDGLRTELQYAREAFSQAQDELQLVKSNTAIGSTTMAEMEAQRRFNECQRLEYQLYLLTK